MAKVYGEQDQTELITLAIAGIDAQIGQLQEKRAQLVALASGSSKAVPVPAAAPAAAGRKKRVFSAATRKKLKLAAKRRWERARAEQKAPAKAAKAAKGAKAEKAS